MLSKPWVRLLILCCLPWLCGAVTRLSAPQEDLNKRFATNFGAGTCSASTLNTIMNNNAAGGGLSDVTTTVVIPPYPRNSNTPCTWNISSAVTTLATLELEIPRGPVLTPASGITVTLGSCPKAGPYQIFNADGTTTGNVVFASTAHCAGPIYAEWWGATGAGTGNDAKAINAALAAVAATGNELQLLAGKRYRTTEPLRYKDNTRWRGQGREDTIIECTTGVCIEPFDDDQNYQHNLFQDFGIQCEDESAPYDCTVGFHYGGGRYGILRNIYINRMETHGLLVDPQNADGGTGSYYNEFDNIVIRGVTENCVSTVRGDDDDRPNGLIWKAGHWQNCAVGFNGEDGGSQRFVAVAIEGVTENFVYNNASGWTMLAPRMEVANALESDQGIVFGPDGSGLAIEGGTMSGGYVNTANSTNPQNYCFKGFKINGEIHPQYCPMEQTVTAPVLVGNPHGCWGPSENLLQRSEGHEAPWESVGTVTIDANSVTSPMGGANADAYTFDNTAGATPERAQDSAVLASGATVYFGAWLKTANTYGTIRWRLIPEGPGSGDDELGTFNVSPHWQYHWTTATFCTAGAGGCAINAADVVRVAFRRVVNENDVGTLHVWGAQLGLGNRPNCYIATTNNTVSKQNVNWSAFQLNATDDGVVIPSNAGGFTDSFFDVDTNGLLGSDSSNNRIYVRVGGNWRWVATSSGIQMRPEDAHDHLLGYRPDGTPVRPFEAGDIFVWIINGFAEDGGAHAEPVLLSTVLKQQLTDLGVSFQDRPLQRRVPQRTWQPNYYDEHTGQKLPDLALDPETLRIDDAKVPPWHPRKKQREQGGERRPR